MVSAYSFRTLPLLTLALLISACDSALHAPTAAVRAQSLGQSFYVNNSVSSCSDTGAGSLSVPWCTFANVNGRVFQPGDHLLLARGATWTQPMDLHGSGTASGYITVDAYGQGSRPVIGVALESEQKPALRILRL